MKASWYIAIVTLFVVLQIVMVICENVYDNQMQETVGALVEPNVVYNPTDTMTMDTNPNFFDAIFKIMAWDYPFLTGGFTMVKYIICYPLSIGLVFGLLVLARGGGGG